MEVGDRQRRRRQREFRQRSSTLLPWTAAAVDLELRNARFHATSAQFHRRAQTSEQLPPAVMTADLRERTDGIHRENRRSLLGIRAAAAKEGRE